ncbi:MAG: hypothetical protein GX254_01015 [Clostridiales bacterium]|jgi:parvulin-like peptidyl-prolyl isomerase|nr:hypothetical protein [Clostridiales bacterium]
MSASQEKKKRRELRAQGIDKKQERKTKTLKEKKREKRIKTAVTVGVILLLVVLVVFNSSLFYTVMAAVKIGDWNFTAAEFNYYYNSILNSIYNSYYQQFGEYASMLLDIRKPLSKQQYTEGVTWEEYIETQAMEKMKSVAMLVTAAENEGYVLNQDAEDEIQNIMTDYKAASTQSGFPGLDSFLKSNFGKGVNEKLLRKLVRWEVTASYYQKELLDRLEYTHEELDGKYDENASEYNLITYCRYYVDGSANMEEGLDETTAMNEAFKIADTIKAGRTEEAFADLVMQYVPEERREEYSEPDALLRKNISPSSLNDVYREWLTSPERKYGDTEVFESGTGYYVLLYVESNDNSYNLKNFRHILVKAALDEETGEVTANSVLMAKKSADDIYAEWQKEPTEDRFIELVAEKSEDPGSNTKGGLYEDVLLGQMVPEIEEWLFSGDRKPGDTEVLYVSSGSYSGYHIIYFVGNGERRDRMIARELLEKEWYEEWIASQEADYQIDTTIAYWFAK